MKDVVLANGVRMPAIGFGVFQLRDPEECGRCVGEALRAGYRLVDTAAAYFNEEAVGAACAAAFRDGVVSRDEVFLTTKVWLQDFDREAAKRSVALSLRKLGVERLDLVLLHQPFGDWMQAWKGLEDLYRDGVVRAIGLSNFPISAIDRLLQSADIAPQVDQVEHHPFFTRGELVAALAERRIAVQAWGPLCEGQKGIFHHPVLAAVARAHERSVAQVVLRWSLQRGVPFVVKSRVPAHMREDLDLEGFRLTEEELRRIDALDIGHSEIIDFASPATARLLQKLKIHA